MLPGDDGARVSIAQQELVMQKSALYHDRSRDTSDTAD